MRDRQVHDYIRDLDKAMRGLPPQQAAELREQILSHLDDAIDADASDDEIYRVLHDLGRPRDLIAEGWPERSEPTPPALQTVIAPPRRKWRLKLAIAVGAVVVLTIVGAVADHLISEWSGRNTGSLDVFGFAPLNDAEVTGGVNSPVTFPIRAGEMQGIQLEMSNRTSLTQTILGYSDGGERGGLFGTPGYDIRSYPSGPPSTNFRSAGPLQAAPIVFEPGQTRIVILTWIVRSPLCFQAGSYATERYAQLRVHVGWSDRIETLPLLSTVRLYASKNTC